MDQNALTQTLNAAITTAQQGNEALRLSLKNALQAALQQVETPHEMFWRMLVEPHSYAVVRSGISLGIFRALGGGEGGPKTAEELASALGAETLLVVRLMRVLSGLGIVNEVAANKYENAAAGKVLAEDAGMTGALSFMFDVAGQAAMKIPEVLKENQWRNPSRDPIVFKKAFGDQQNAFSWLGTHPEVLGDFNNMMTAQRFNRKNWYEFFPVPELLLEGFEGGPLLVDIGGAQGFELECFRKRFPDAKGELILQDLPPVIDSIRELDPSIRRMKHDFFTPQPIQGSRAYYLRSIFHDWPDDKCRSILRNLKPAMKPGYSKLLINDWVLPEERAPLYPALLDINMLALFSSMERTASQFTEILESEGYEIVKFHTVPGNEGLIEAEVRR